MREKSEFVGDIESEGFLSMILLRSPVVRGILKSIETPPLPGKVYLIKAADIPGINRVEWPDGALPVLAENRLSYIGEPVAILAGPDESLLMDIALECTIMADETEPPFDCAPACGDIDSTPEKTAALRVFNTGDTGEAFEKAAAIVEGSYSTGFQEAWSTDPNGAIAVPVGGKSSGVCGMIIHAASQWPFHVKNSVAKVLGIDTDTVEFRQARLELHMNGKFLYPSLCSCQAALAAWITGKAVKFILGRSEDFRFSPKRAKTEIVLKSALDKNGCILGTRLEITADMGSGPVFLGETLDRIALGALGAYRHGAVSLNARAALSSVPPASPLAGFGFAEGFFAMERHASRIADELREDPAEWRKNTYLHKGSRFAIGSELKEHLAFESLLDTASSMSDYRRKWAAFELLRRRNRAEETRESRPEYHGEKLRGIGIAAAFQGNGLLYPAGEKEGVELTLEKNGSLEIRTSMARQEDEQSYPWKAIAMRELGVEEHMIRIVTEGKNIPDSGPACLSRSISVITRLVERACEAVKKQRFRDPLPITVCRYYSPSRAKAWDSQSLYDENTLSAPGCCAAVVETEIDMAQYIPRVKGIWLAVDGGAILAENHARKKLTLLSIQAINWASREAVTYKNGIIPGGIIHNYPLPVFEEIPPVKIDFHWSEKQSKGIGELPFAVIPAAYVQSVSQAMDHFFTKIPVGSADIWNAVSEKRKEAAKNEEEKQ